MIAIGVATETFKRHDATTSLIVDSAQDHRGETTTGETATATAIGIGEETTAMPDHHVTSATSNRRSGKAGHRRRIVRTRVHPEWRKVMGPANLQSSRRLPSLLLSR